MRRANRPHDSWKDYAEAVRTLQQELLRTPEEVACAASRRERRADAHRVAGEFFRELGNPQRAYPAIHVAGTSGKGSVAWAIAHLLRAAGLRVGLHVSPYLQVATEKVWIDGRYLDGTTFARLVERVARVARRYRSPECPATVHGMASAAVAFEAFRRARVDVAVIEACCGGRYDITAHLRTRVAVITTVGDDHRDVLGPTLRDVAWHKAGILRRGAAAVSGVGGGARRIVRAEARALGVRLVEVPMRRSHVSRANRGLAEVAVAAWGIAPPPETVVPPFPGRIETVAAHPRVVLDIAHNAQKMRGLLRSLDGTPRRGILVCGFVRGKHPGAMLHALSRRFRSVVFTEPRVPGKPAIPAADLLAAFRPFFADAAADAHPARALDLALRIAGPRTTLLVTGSAYLVGAVRGRWYPTRRVLLERTSFPGTR